MNTTIETAIDTLLKRVEALETRTAKERGDAVEAIQLLTTAAAEQHKSLGTLNERLEIAHRSIDSLQNVILRLSRGHGRAHEAN